MKIIKLLLFLVMSPALLFCRMLIKSEEQGNNTLILLHVIFRHGDRTPDNWYGFKTDPHQNETYYPIGHGQLTKKGKKTAYNIGKYIREAYSDFLPNQYTPDVLHARSTNFKRTKMTLQLVLAGLFPPKNSDVFIEGLKWQPIPFEYESTPDVLRIAPLHCSHFISKYFEYFMSEDAQKMVAPYRDLYDELSKYSGQRIQSPKDVARIYFTLKGQYDWGLKLPEWTEKYFPKILEEATALDYEFNTATAALKRLSAGFLVEKILKDTESKIYGFLPNGRKLYLYSAHEYNIATMLRTLNVYYPHVPPFGATLYFEIHRINGEYGLKLFYQDYSTKSPRAITIPTCDNFCKLHDFYSIFKDSLPTKDDYCNLNFEL